MATTETKDKAALAEKIREILQVDIKFEKLSKDELTKLYQLLTNLQNLATIGVNQVRQKFQHQIQTQLLDRKLGEIIQDQRLFGKNGILGLGILSDKGILGLGIMRSLIQGTEESKGES